MKECRPEPVPLAAHLMALAEAVNTGRPVPTGRLFGLPELPDNDYWVDIAGAAAVTGVPPNTITSWLARGGPTRNPFPAPRRHLYRLYWPCTEISMSQTKRRLAGDNPLYHPARCRSPALPSGPCQVTSNECPRPSPWPRPARPGGGGGRAARPGAGGAPGGRRAGGAEQSGEPGVDQLGGVQSPAPPEGQGLRRQRLCVRRKALQAFTARSARSGQSSRWESPWASVQVKVTTAPVGRVLASVMLQVRSPGCRSLCLYVLVMSAASLRLEFAVGVASRLRPRWLGAQPDLP